MDIQEFVRESLLQIMEGVHAASVSKPGITPSNLQIAKGHKPPAGAFVFGIAHSIGFLAEFDLAVTVSDKSAASGKAGLSVVQVFNAGGEKSASNETVSVSRIKFSVPISYA